MRVQSLPHRTNVLAAATGPGGRVFALGGYTDGGPVDHVYRLDAGR